eukprot:286620-Pelagomonas_calceolata.AAC.11
MSEKQCSAANVAHPIAYSTKKASQMRSCTSSAEKNRRAQRKFRERQKNMYANCRTRGALHKC